ncbi:MAG: dTDP-4-dehydrorhamnose reductase [Chloroflexi bacterium]|nr:dTDP-4-dehydrorhamnose reductase [Chloroflexota bacterium]
MTILILGHKGQLGRLLYEYKSGKPHVGLDLPEFDMTDGAAVMARLRDIRPELVINAAAYTNVDGAEANPDLAYAVNAHAVAHVARACRELDVPLLHISTNEVFDGTREGQPYDEWDQPHALSTYARSKLAGENAARFHHHRLYIVRIAWLFAPQGNNFPAKIVAAADKYGALRVVNDEFGNPTYAPHLVQAIFTLLQREAPYGIYHLTNQGYASRYEFAREVLRESGREHIPVTPIPHTDWPRPSQPPLRAILANRAAAALGVQLPPWQEAVAEWARRHRQETK